MPLYSKKTPDLWRARIRITRTVDEKHYHRYYRTCGAKGFRIETEIRNPYQTILQILMRLVLIKYKIANNHYNILKINFLCAMNHKAAIAHLQQEATIQPLLANIEMPDFMPSGKVYYNLLESIVSQQLSVKVADVIFKRFLSLFSDNYPHPDSVVAIDFEKLRSVGLSGQKANYLQNVAQFALENDLEKIDWALMSDDEIISFLTQIKGVGKWTVQMLLMFTIGRPDIFPVDDLGIQQAMQRLFKIEEQNPRLLKIRMIELAEPWRPWRTVACRYLWRWKDS